MLKLVKHIISVLIVSGLLLAGCSHCPSKSFVKYQVRPKEAMRFFAELDQAVERSGGRNAADYCLPGFPYLRTSRFLASHRFYMAASANKRVGEVWINRMRERDVASRKIEIINLPAYEREKLIISFGLSGKTDDFFDLMVNYAEHLYTVDRQNPEFMASVIKCLDIPDEYSSLTRIAALYPLAALPVLYVTNQTREGIRSRLSLSADEIPVTGKLITFSPPETDFPSYDYPRRLLASKTPDPLGLFSLTKTETRNLALALAPNIIQDKADLHDEFGRISWKNNNIQIDGRRPTLYYYTSYMFIRNRPMLQVNYTLWYSRRDGALAPRSERGPIDGITLRITIDHQGTPFMLETMNTCGGNHVFAPRQENIAAIRSRPFALDPLVPVWLPPLSDAKRISLRINSGWHQVVNISSTGLPKNAVGYDLTPYEYLESIPLAPGRYESMFNQKGIVKGSTRIKPYMYFPLGISDLGSMRQRGRHPILLLGKAHFDDPELFNDSFVFH